MLAPGIEQDRPRRAVLGHPRRHIQPGPDTDRLEIGPAKRGAKLRSFIAVELQTIQRTARQHRLHVLGVGIDKQPDAGDQGCGALQRLHSLRRRHRARAGGIEHKSQRVGAGGTGRRRGSGIADPADLHTGSGEWHNPATPTSRSTKRVIIAEPQRGSRTTPAPGKAALAMRE